MLYITTRDKIDSFTAPRVLSSDRGPDGGLFVPFRMPKLTREEVLALSERGFSQIVADLLNQFFSAGLSGWDVDFCVGRKPVKLVPMNYRIWILEMWHNQENTFHWLAQRLLNRISGKEQPLTDWGGIAVRIGVLFGIFGELMQQKIADFEHPMDVAVQCGDFSGPMAVWYAREMGLPIGTIVCSCHENGNTWDLLSHGQFYTDGGLESVGMPETGSCVPSDLERFIFGVLGYEENQNYVECCRRGKCYTLGPYGTEQLRNEMFGAVVSESRMEGIIRNTRHSANYLLDPAGALAFGGLQDYRAKSGGTGPALILSEQGPDAAAEPVARALGMSAQAFLEYLKKR